MADTPLPPPDELPVLPNMDESMDLDLAIDDNGEAYIFYTKPIPEAVNWAEFDSENSYLYLIAENGRIQGLGLKVYDHMAQRLASTHRIFAIHVENGAHKQIIEMPLIHQLTKNA